MSGISYDTKMQRYIERRTSRNNALVEELKLKVEKQTQARKQSNNGSGQRNGKKKLERTEFWKWWSTI